MQLDTLPVLEGRSVTLRQAQTDDAEARFRLGNPPEILEMLGVSRDAVRPLLWRARQNGFRTLLITLGHG